MAPRTHPLQHLVLIRTPHTLRTRSLQPESRSRATPAWLERALSLMDASLERRWTVSALARQVAMSRPVFARRFRAALGTSPLRHLTTRRMQRAAQLLEQPDLSLAEVAERVGYASEFAFNRAFKRHFQVAPGSFRRALRAAEAPSFRLAA